MNPKENKAKNTKKLITLEEVKQDSRVINLLRQTNKQMKVMGFTEHGDRHAHLVGNIARNILLKLGFNKRTAELAAIAGYFHDIGNVIHRESHAHAGALIAMDILQDSGMDPEEVAVIMGAIGNHEEERGIPVSEVAAAIIIADKTDVHCSRVQKAIDSDHNIDGSSKIQDLHDRVNYSTKRSFVYADSEKKTINLKIDIDTKISPIMDYFEIFLSRMMIARRAANFLGCKFELHINETKLF
ncbi:HD domain-containing protein [Patescibacteria group bacterium]|nr:HD domain-containing protein [Patescibacteria group bacterium]